MPNYSTEGLMDLTEATTNPIPEQLQARVDTAPTCQPGDTECISRWVQAFSDCD